MTDNDRLVSVGVLVDLDYGPLAGGHVKTWERFAEAVAAMNDPQVDLTVYFLGRHEAMIPIARHVRYHLLPPMLASERLRFVRQVGGHTDLTRFHRKLAARLPRHHVLHITSAFGFGRTAARVARTCGQALVYSIHTDAISLARVYTQDAVRNLLGSRHALTRLLLQRLRVQEWSAQAQSRSVARLLTASDHVFVSNAVDHAWVTRRLPASAVSMLRRGIDRDRFHPRWRDREWLAARFNIPVDMPVVLFAGRIDDSKRVMTVVEAVARYNTGGRRAHAVLAGDGQRAGSARERLGPLVTLTGTLPQTDLARLMASADLFAFPSEIETVGNVVIEAMAAGLPVIVSARGAPARLVREPGRDGIVLHSSAQAAWTRAVAAMLDSPATRERMGQNARATVEAHSPSWADVVQEDLLPIWSRLGRSSRAVPPFTALARAADGAVA